MAKFMQVAIGYAGKSVAVTDIQKTFGSAGWARYAPNCWIIYTNEQPSAIAERIRAFCDQKDSIFVCELDIYNNFGYLQKEIWDWINERK